ncbi:hypothetical protein U9M48_019645 [Paspalum notatum var. saurae]|uniref:Tf2-1-like SH3-like domain-containing protein n=1 Tax=Paspalum notatum var. saurae TaxID=547442 RepID=A0AAQ3TCM3_PASNO
MQSSLTTIATKRLEANSLRKSYAYKRRRDLTFEVNDFVYPKLAPVYIGPFKVLEKKGVVAYKLELPPALRST